MSKRTRWVVLRVALVLVVGGTVTAGVVLHGRGRGPGSSTPTTATVPLTATKSCTLKTLDVTKHLWETPVSHWSSEIAATQQLHLSRYGSGSRYLNAFTAAANVGFPAQGTAVDVLLSPGSVRFRLQGRHQQFHRRRESC